MKQFRTFTKEEEDQSNSVEFLGKSSFIMKWGGTKIDPTLLASSSSFFTPSGSVPVLQTALNGYGFIYTTLTLLVNHKMTKRVHVIYF